MIPATDRTAEEPAMNTMTENQHLIDALALTDDERQPCEVWTRVMGYHRPVASFNIGKKGEHSERCFFREELTHPHL
jgi:Anaerobic ribonucleoside-triphosphate reductase